MNSVFDKLVESNIGDTKMQSKIDKYAGIYIVTKSKEWCWSSLYIAGHYYKALGKYIKSLSKWTIFTYNWCSYKVTNKITGLKSKIEATAKFDVEWQMYLQTCYTKDWKRIYFITSQNETP